MMHKLFGINYITGRKITWNFFFIPVFKIKGRFEQHFRVYILGIPLWKISTESFQALSSRIMTKKNCESYVEDLATRNAEPYKDFVPITTSP